MGLKVDETGYLGIHDKKIKGNERQILQSI